MALPQRRAVVIPIRMSDERRSEVRDLLRKTRLEQLRVAIEEGRFVIDPETIANGVIDDIIGKGLK